MKPNINRVRSNGTKNPTTAQAATRRAESIAGLAGAPVAVPDLQPSGPNKTARPQASFLDMEDSVTKAIALLRILSTNLANHWENAGNRMHDHEACGAQLLADDCAQSLYDQWDAAHKETRRLRAGERVNCTSAATLVLHVEKTITLLRFLADENAEIESRQAEAEAERSGTVLALGPSGFSELASEVIESLRSQYNVASEAWLELENRVKVGAPALASAA